MTITNEGPAHRYFAALPHIVWELGLDPLEITLLAYYIRIAGKDGTCWQGTATIAEKTGISTGKVSQARRILAEIGLIQVQEKGQQGRGKPYRITIVDLWPLNVAYFNGDEEARKKAQAQVEALRQKLHQVKEKKTSPGEVLEAEKLHQVRFYDPKTSPGEMKKNPIEEKPMVEEKPPPCGGNPDCTLPDAETQATVLFGRGQRSARPWSIPPQAGGADDFGQALLPIFCEGTGIPPASLSQRKYRQWQAELRKPPEQWAATLEQSVAALHALFNPRSEFAWRAYNSPSQRTFQDDWGVLLARAVAGEPLIRPPAAKQKGAKRTYGGRGDFPD